MFWSRIRPPHRKFSLPPCATTPYLFFFFNDTATTEIYTLSLHDALPISARPDRSATPSCATAADRTGHSIPKVSLSSRPARSGQHTSELQSHSDVVWRLLLQITTPVQPSAGIPSLATTPAFSSTALHRTS